MAPTAFIDSGLGGGGGDDNSLSTAEIWLIAAVAVVALLLLLLLLLWCCCRDRKAASSDDSVQTDEFSQMTARTVPVAAPQPRVVQFPPREPPPSGIILDNPYYGVRLDNDDDGWIDDFEI